MAAGADACSAALRGVGDDGTSMRGDAHGPLYSLAAQTQPQATARW